MKTKVKDFWGTIFCERYIELFILCMGLGIWHWAKNVQSFNLAIMGIVLIFLVNLGHSICCFKKEFVYFFMQISIFTFLISRPFLGWITGEDWWNNASQAEENVWFALSLLVLTETALYIGNLLADYRVKKKCIGQKTKYISDELTVVSQLIFYSTMIFYLFEQFEPLIAIGVGNYVNYYTEFTSQLPGVFHTIASFMKYSLCIYLATLPSKRKAIIPLGLYVFSTFPSLLVGVRNPFVLSLLFCLVYFLLRDYLGDSKKWIGKVEKILLIVFTPIFLVFLKGYTAIRAGNGLGGHSFFSSVFDFFYSQGVSFDVLCIGYGYMPGLKIICPCNYTFGNIIDYLYRGSIGSKIFHTEPLTAYNSVFNATNGNNLSHALSYLSLKEEYLEGRGRGSSYLLEVMTDYGYLGVFIFSLLLGGILIFMVHYFGKRILLSTIILVCLQNIFFIPRAEATGWLTFIVTIQFWSCMILCYICTKICQKWDLLSKTRKIRLIKLLSEK